MNLKSSIEIHASAPASQAPAPESTPLPRSVTLSNLNAHWDERARIEAEAKEKIARLDAERAELIRLRQPFNELLELRLQKIGELERLDRLIAQCESADAQFQDELAYALRSEATDAVTLADWARQRQHLSMAHVFAGRVKLFRPGLVSQISKVESDLKKSAAEIGAEADLPDSLKVHAEERAK